MRIDPIHEDRHRRTAEEIARHRELVQQRIARGRWILRELGEGHPDAEGIRQAIRMGEEVLDLLAREAASD